MHLAPPTVAPATPGLNSSITTEVPKAAGGEELFNKPKTIEYVVGVLTHPPATVAIHEIVPRGAKENVAFLVNNTNNHQRRLHGKKSEFWDDCGSWSTSGASPKTLLLRDGDNLRQVTRNKSGLYCTPKMVKCVRTQAVIEPQPATSDIIHTQRNYSNIGGYKRRVTWINSDDEQQLAFYEYLGKLILTMFTMHVIVCLSCNKQSHVG